MHVVGGEDGEIVPLRQFLQPVDPRPVITAIEPRYRDMAERRKHSRHIFQLCGEGGHVRLRYGDEKEFLAEGARDIGQRQVTRALRLPLAFGILHLPRRKQGA